MKSKLLIMASVTAGMLLGAGCKKDFEQINTDPNHTTVDKMDFNFLFTSAQLITSGNSDANGYEDWRNNLIYSACMIQHLSSTTGYWDGDKYFYNASYNSAYWDNNYNNSFTNIVEVVEHTKTDPAKANFYNIARIFKAFMFQRITDMYGDCPYSQAGLGFISNITSPKYDKQQDIYNDLFKELQDAASKLDPAAANTVGKADLLYGGDVGKWKKFAYSEMVRLAMRLSKVDAANAQKWVQAAVAGGVMEGNGDNAILQHDANGGTPTPNGSGLILIGNDPTASRLSQTFVELLKANSDPRLSYLGTVCADPGVTGDMGDTTAAVQLGQPNGWDLSGSERDIVYAPNYPGVRDPASHDGTNKYSVVNRYTFSRLDAPTAFLTYGQTQLLLAEAASRGWISGTAADYYKNGVSASITQLVQMGAGPSGATADDYAKAHPLNDATALEQINNQYWIATFMDENESWANWRRSGYPTLTPVNYPNNNTNGTIPRRFTYPQGEPSTNAANYKDAVSRLTDGDKMTSRVWWDKQ
ncbi:SusD/RagB family nutrient-binding outer membrane lipoprotein [Deminuibacter soli]|uniref:SusD/RagB family nutrient-binding outer membrane lipoprotein n=1 Tax=Deminuibacter soli TaxID=2291815 RepID=A0A3E1NIH3_9BACT|nr:SusD/RagB family nutrient-binding outer membrane lipoprotein [Deminuibacter soli]RFM27681.1 SusD/RagB family nutrient-binding outer membrane lipoprotein [Deminuibacter soli]